MGSPLFSVGMSEADSEPGAGWITANFARANFSQMARPDFDLSQASVFLDFDGTISTVDVGMHLLDRAASPEWWELHEQFERGEIGSRECILGQWALVEGDAATLRAVAGEIALDPGFVPLVDAVRDAGAELVVVSDGFGFYVHDACAPLGIDVLTNAVDFATGELRFPHEDPRCACSSCGVCKQAPIRDAQQRGRTTVLIGDGASDRPAASLADVVFAKGSLASWCSTAGVTCTPFATLDDVRQALCP
jgi:2-hydroxy-3-keto-5-methylthiopentenyl-1-phosphate phosphatase